MKKNSRNLNHENLERARTLRKAMSESEQKLWAILKGQQLSFRFRKQCPVGIYTLDFYCPEAKLCIELDGDLHDGREAQDAARDDWMQSRSIGTLRITTAQLYYSTEAVRQLIYLECVKRTGREID